MRINDIIKEVKNYNYLRGVIRKNKDSVEWKKHNLNIGYFGVIYTVINLPADVAESEEQYYSVYIMEMMMPINNYLESLNIQEIIVPRIDNLVNKDKGIYAYGIKYVPLFRDLTWGYVITRLFGIAFAVWLQYKFSFFTAIGSHAMDYVKKFMDWVL